MKKTYAAIAIWCLLALSGCKDADWARLTSDTGEKTIVESDPRSQRISDEVTRRSESLRVNKYGVAFKAIAQSSSASIVDSPSANASLIRPVRMGEFNFIFRSSSNRQFLPLGADPSREREGFGRSKHFLVTTSKELLKLRPETASIRKKAELFESFELLLKRAKSENPSRPRATWVEESSTDGIFQSMPILDFKDIEVNGATIRAVKVGALTWNAKDDLQELSRHRRETARKDQEALRRLDVVFVVDATDSMSHVWEELSAYLNDILDSFQSNPQQSTDAQTELATKPKLNVHVSVLAYRDHEDNDGWLFKRCQLNGDTAAVKDWLAGIEATAGGDWREAMFDAVVEAATKTRWREGSHRVILLAANNASHSADDELKNPDKLTTERVIQAAHSQSVHIWGLQLPYAAEFDGDEGALTRQLAALAKGSDGGHLTIDASESKKVDLIAHFQELGRESSRLPHQVIHVHEQATNGIPLDEIRKKLGLSAPAFRRVVSEVERRSGADLNRIQVQDAGSIGFDTGWTVYMPQTWQLCVMLREDEADILMASLDLIIRHGPDDPKRLIEAFQELLVTVLGEQDLEPTTVEMALKANGVPLRENSLLAVDPKELLAMPRAARLQLAEVLKDKYAKLAMGLAKAERDGQGNMVIPFDLLP